MKQSAHDGHETISKNDTVDLIKLDPELAERIGKIESTSLDNYYKLILVTDSTCKIEWGNKRIKKQSMRDYYFSEARRLYFDWENEDFLVLKAGRGSDAWFNVFLSLDSVGRDEIIENTLTQDKKRSLVIAECSSPDTTMVIHNLKSKELQYIIETDKCSSVFVHYCIDTIAFTDKGLYYKWTLPNKLDDNPKTYERRVRIKI
jgi:hypothetical protein